MFIFLMIVLGIPPYIFIASTIYKFVGFWKKSLKSTNKYQTSPLKYYDWCIFDSGFIIREFVSVLWPIGLPIWISIFILRSTLFCWLGMGINFTGKLQDKVLQCIFKPREEKQKEGLSFLK